MSFAEWFYVNVVGPFYFDNLFEGKIAGFDIGWEQTYENRFEIMVYYRKKSLKFAVTSLDDKVFITPLPIDGGRYTRPYEALRYPVRIQSRFRKCPEKVLLSELVGRKKAARYLDTLKGVIKRKFKEEDMF